MGDIKQNAELAWRQVFPNPGDEASVTREEFVDSARSIYSRALWIQSKQEKREEGLYNLPSQLLKEVELDVKENRVSLSGLNIMRSFPNWLQNVGGLTCEYSYIVSDINTHQLLCDDDSQEGLKTVVPLSEELWFPQGTHQTPIKIIYASDGTDIEIDEALAATVREQLVNLYSRKGVEDETNNTSSTT